MKINTTETVANALGLTPQRVRQLVKELNIEPTMIGKAIVLSDADVKKLERRKTQRGPTKKEKK
ncbi:MAG: hypothetical protein AABN95_16185 [Acidobacteriota bacterium]